MPAMAPPYPMPMQAAMAPAYQMQDNLDNVDSLQPH